MAILDRMDDAFMALDTGWYVSYANDRARAILRLAMPEVGPDDPVEGRHLWDSIPAAVGTRFHDNYHRAMERQESVTFEEYFEPLETWFAVRAYPSETGLSVYFRDVTEERRLHQERQESLQALQRLASISSDRKRAFDDKLTDLLGVGCEYLGLPNGFLTRIEEGTQHIEVSASTHPLLQPGESCPLDEAYCRRTIELDDLLTVVNAADEGWRDDPAYGQFGLESYLGGRVEVDGELYGTLCFADTDPRDEAFTDTERTFVELLTRWVSYELERERARARLQRERDRLDEFASVVGHDLRNPLSTASAYLTLLRDEDEAEHHEYLEILENALDRMDELLDDLLALARQGAVVEDPEPVGLADIVDAAWRTTGAADASLSVDPDIGWVVADRGRLQQLFENLFRNSVEHAGEDVAVTVGPLADRTGFYVADDGPGIPPDERGEVFRTGYTTSERGTGFGLAIVEQIAAAHGWELRVGESDGGGARFEVTGVELG